MEVAKVGSVSTRCHRVCRAACRGSSAGTEESSGTGAPPAAPGLPAVILCSKSWIVSSSSAPAQSRTTARCAASRPTARLQAGGRAEVWNTTVAAAKLVYLHRSLQQPLCTPSATSMAQHRWVCACPWNPRKGGAAHQACPPASPPPAAGCRTARTQTWTGSRSQTARGAGAKERVVRWPSRGAENKGPENTEKQCALRCFQSAGEAALNHTIRVRAKPGADP